MKHTKAQAALEFILTYGWAFAVIPVALGTLSYMGLFNVEQFVDEKCTIYSGLYCIDYKAEDTGVRIYIQNGLPFGITQVEVNVEACNLASGPVDLASAESALYVADCTLYRGIFSSPITIKDLNPETGFNHTKAGEIVYRVS